MGRQARLDYRAVVELSGKRVVYGVRQSSRARHVWLRADAENGLVVSAPARYSRGAIEQILTEKADWVLKQTDHLNSLPPRKPLGELRDGQTVPFRGVPRPIALTISSGNGNRGTAQLIDDRIHIVAPTGYRLAGRQVLEAWMRHQARRAVIEEVLDLDPEGGLEYGKICIRDQKTRWGSCSSKGTLSFSWRLVLAPPEILRYVVAHELAHLGVAKHSQRFWRVVERMCPDYAAHRQWLRDHGAELTY